ncbi:hypothetical protein [Bacillus sp. FJAT-26390]|uniref:hypothetical protein n=1 Tax=Bacillus sp. FJAT-26390 TaxID=1743142 RepID=UPI0008081779|nr:hypothetical protein [Bacillus sp. FJAT-26390]OBZ15628.1 hypothetical protein A7975_30855 [Bacillus sp. FJAT-26390]
MAMPLIEINDSALHRPPASEEIQLIHDAIILPLTLVVVERNRRELDRKARALRSIFAKAAAIVMLQIKADLTTNTKVLIRKGITVCLDNSSSGNVSYRYNCRGFEAAAAFSHEYIRNEINRRISAYNADIFIKDASARSIINRI